MGVSESALLKEEESFPLGPMLRFPYRLPARKETNQRGDEQPEG